MIVYYILVALTTIYSLYFAFFGVAIFFKKRKKPVPTTDKKNYFAILVAARNEEKVIGSLIESLNNLDYPKDKYEIIVIPNNCTDNTETVAKEAGARILSCDVPTKSKGDVLQYTFKKLTPETNIDAYVVFDADNIVDKHFLTHMNDALNCGYRVATGFRDAKNPGDNWITGSYAIFYLFQNVFYNRSRYLINANASINGTGYMIKKSKIDEEGFKTDTLTEDVEYTGQCALKGEKILFVEDAITYDEFPSSFKISWKQRKRWTSGNLHCMREYNGRLFKNFFKTGSIPSLDIAMANLGPFYQVISTLLAPVPLIINIVKNGFSNPWFYIFTLISLAVTYFGSALVNLFIVLYKHKRVKDLILGIIFFSVFIITYFPINLICIITRYNKWEPIEHNRVISIHEINSR